MLPFSRFHGELKMSNNKTKATCDGMTSAATSQLHRCIMTVLRMQVSNSESLSFVPHAPIFEVDPHFGPNQTCQVSPTVATKQNRTEQLIIGVLNLIRLFKLKIPTHLDLSGPDSSNPLKTETYRQLNYSAYGKGSQKFTPGVGMCRDNSLH